MISLLLTLFISLFSFCPSVNRLEDQYENNIIESSFIVEKKAFTNQQYLYLTTYDLVNPSNVLATIEALSQNSSLPTSGGSSISGEDFSVNGGSILLNSSTFRTAVSFYIDNIGYQGNNDLQPRPDFTFDALEYVYSIRDDNHKSFEINIYCHNSSFSYVNKYKSYQITEVFNGQLQQCWTCYVESLQGNIQYSSSRLIYCFNQNITYDYFRLGDDSYESGYRDGYSLGFEDGRIDTQATYDEQVYEEGRQAGYAEGLQYATDTGSTASTIFNGIFDVGLLPINVFLTIFNFEVFGINIAGIVSALLTLSVVIIIVRFLIGGKSNDK